MKRQNLRTVSLIVVTLTYLLIGAAIFGWLESDFELQQRDYLDLIELIVKRKYNISEDDFTVLTTTVIKSVPHRAGIQWRFSGAFYFATTVVTTIGYGHSTPATVWGRSFCMIYALIGIPLGLVMFQSIGERLNTFVAWGLKHMKRCYKAKNPEVTQTNLVMVVLVLSTILMTSMAAVFAKYERWDYFDALYYCFITLTTIGFGDYVALQKESALQSKPEYVALSLIFILFGLSVVSSAVNLLVLKFLTLNTEDERRDEQLRFTANQNPIQLEGDVITSASLAPAPVHHLNRRRHHHDQPESVDGAKFVGEPALSVVSHQRLAGRHYRRQWPLDAASCLQQQQQHRHHRHQFASDTLSDEDEDDEDEEEEEEDELQLHRHHHQPPLPVHSHNHKLSAATSFQSGRAPAPSSSNSSDVDLSCSCSHLSIDASANHHHHQWASLGSLRRSILAPLPPPLPPPTCCLSTTIKPHHYHHHQHLQHRHRRRHRPQPLTSHRDLPRTRQRRHIWELEAGHLSGSEHSVRASHRQQLSTSSSSMRVAAHQFGSPRSNRSRVTTRLVCKCCCSHSDCIERALANMGSPAPAPVQVSKPLTDREPQADLDTTTEVPGDTGEIQDLKAPKASGHRHEKDD